MARTVLNIQRKLDEIKEKIGISDYIYLCEQLDDINIYTEEKRLRKSVNMLSSWEEKCLNYAIKALSCIDSDVSEWLSFLLQPLWKIQFNGKTWTYIKLDQETNKWQKSTNIHLKRCITEYGIKYLETMEDDILFRASRWYLLSIPLVTRNYDDLIKNLKTGDKKKIYCSKITSSKEK